jgi:hypothetical protein
MTETQSADDPWARLAPRWCSALASLHRLGEALRQAADPCTLAEQVLQVLDVEVLTKHSAERIRANGATIVDAINCLILLDPQAIDPAVLRG